jgi:hypothetical protein
MKKLLVEAKPCEFALKVKGIPSKAHISTPFFKKTVFFSKICFGSPSLKNFGGMSKIGIYVILKFNVQL